MDAELKAKWVKALRSGEYQQGRGRLYDRNDDSYCCLGVLCVIADAPRAQIESGSILPHSFEAGILPDQESALISMNDGKQAPFLQIADWIEANL